MAKTASARPAKKTRRTDSTIGETIRLWSDAQKKRALTQLVREFIRDGSQPVYIMGVGIITPILGLPRLVELDDSTPHLREMRRRAENPEGSLTLEEIIEERKKRATSPV